MEVLVKAILLVLDLVLQLAIWVLIIQAVLSWLIAFNVVNTRNGFVMSIWQALHQVTEPLLRPIRGFLPRTSGIDLAPLVLILLIIFLRYVNHLYLIPNVP